MMGTLIRSIWKLRIDRNLVLSMSFSFSWKIGFRISRLLTKSVRHIATWSRSTLIDSVKSRTKISSASSSWKMLLRSQKSDLPTDESHKESKNTETITTMPISIATQPSCWNKQQSTRKVIVMRVLRRSKPMGFISTVSLWRNTWIRGSKC